MTRVKRGVTKRARHKKWIDMASGYFGRAGTCYRIARERVERGRQHAYKHRKEFKREMRSLWILRINAACREHGVRYSQFIAGLKNIGCEWNRKMLSECAIHDPASFKKMVMDASSSIQGA